MLPLLITLFGVLLYMLLVSTNGNGNVDIDVVLDISFLFMLFLCCSMLYKKCVHKYSGGIQK